MLDTPPETINFIAVDADISKGVISLLGTKNSSPEKL